MGFDPGCPYPYLIGTNAKLPVAIGRLKVTEAVRGSTRTDQGQLSHPVVTPPSQMFPVIFKKILLGLFIEFM